MRVAVDRQRKWLSAYSAVDGDGVSVGVGKREGAPERAILGRCDDLHSRGDGFRQGAAVFHPDQRRTAAAPHKKPKRSRRDCIDQQLISIVGPGGSWPAGRRGRPPSRMGRAGGTSGGWPPKSGPGSVPSGDWDPRPRPAQRTHRFEHAIPADRSACDSSDGHSRHIVGAALRGSRPRTSDTTVAFRLTGAIAGGGVLCARLSLTSSGR